VFNAALKQPIEHRSCCKTEHRMIYEQDLPGHKAVATERNSELIRAATTTSTVANNTESVERPDSTKHTDLTAGTQTELRSLRDALWEAISGIEEKAPGALIERELVILDRVAEGLGNIVTEPEAVNGTKP
jgi:hypothetical protein